MKNINIIVVFTILFLSVSTPHLALHINWSYGSLFQLLSFFLLVILSCWILLSNVFLKTSISVKAIDLLILSFSFLSILNRNFESMDHNSALLITVSTLVYFAIKSMLIQQSFNRLYSYLGVFIIIGLAIQVAWLILQFLDVLNNSDPTYEVGGSFGHPGYTLGISSIGLLIILSDPNFEKKDKRFKTLLIIFWIIISLFSVYTISRTAILISCLSVILLLKLYSLEKWFIRPKWKVVVLLGLTGVAISYLSWIKLDSIQGRWFIWQKSIDLTVSRPIWGYGTDSFTNVYNRYQIDYFRDQKASDKEEFLADFVTQPYNDLLVVAIEQGLIGFFILLAIVLLILRKTIEEFSRGKYYLFPVLAFILLMTFWGILQESIYSNLLYISLAFWQD